ncbi:endonuclease/exonuclease/phosphatase family protein [Tropicimonas sp. IMCC34043]|uniref:endonuclease/exonuclease/phosphatase family protein n=1 Tax=Tropicimonas sp. IMCC34043 TaxID=2248760 RepID=UPI000E224437|nr:endonuclease/exonuclease/phosphatase family protein [Tropicimonas sp. IMCC34043]
MTVPGRSRHLPLALTLVGTWIAQPVLAQTGAETIRVATFSTELARKGPGLLLRDILSGDDPQVAAVVAVIAQADPDILLLADIDYDLGLAALNALADRLDQAGARYPHRFALRPNSGMATGLDMDGNRRFGEARDAQGYGAFAGQGGLAVLSRFPVDTEAVVDFSGLLWRDLPGATLPEANGAPFPSDPALAAQRLSSTGHWIVPVLLPNGIRLRLLAFAATAPVFDGPEDRNGLRNADEIALWQRCLDGALPGCPPAPPFVILGKANLDPVDGEGRHDAIRALLSDPRLQDPEPESAGAAAAADPDHAGAPAQDTADWPAAAEGGPGNLRVDYVLPSADLAVVDAGTLWPSGGEAHETVEVASHNRLVWVDLVVDR